MTEAIPDGSDQDHPLIAVCLATYDPRIDLFRKQIESIVSQTYRNWICLVSDDASDPEVLKEIRSVISIDKRFELLECATRLGVYRNFERCLTMIPSNAKYVALADQDDSWHAEKLEVLLAHCSQSTSLVYSDMNLVDSMGNTLSNTFWTSRPNKCDDLALLILANTVTGAACLFPVRLLEFALPFPEADGMLHDHWLACAALAIGSLMFVDSALYDYVQHEGQLVGHVAAAANPTFVDRCLSLLESLLVPGPGRDAYFHELPKSQLIATVLELRCGEVMTARKRKSIQRVLALDKSRLALGWLLGRSLRNVLSPTASLEAEQRLLSARLWAAFWSRTSDRSAVRLPWKPAL